MFSILLGEVQLRARAARILHSPHETMRLELHQFGSGTWIGSGNLDSQRRRASHASLGRQLVFLMVNFLSYPTWSGWFRAACDRADRSRLSFSTGLSNSESCLRF